MIISHKHKFIFLKPRKVAGTSVEINLAKHCGSDDIITPLGRYNPEIDETQYKELYKNSDGFYSHISPEELNTKIDYNIWKNYYKITIIRNPWDKIISRYFWDKKNNKNKTKFKKERIKNKLLSRNIIKYIKMFIINKTLNHMIIKANKKSINSFLCIVKYFDNNRTDNNFYFDKKGNPICDFYIRFEHLDEDYKKVCKKIGIPYEPLPRTKTKLRKDKKHYSKYYDEKTKEIVAKKFKRQIDYFGYKFEEEQK